MELTRTKIAIGIAAVAILGAVIGRVVSSRIGVQKPLQVESAEFKAFPRTPDLSGQITSGLTSPKPPTFDLSQYPAPPTPPLLAGPAGQSSLPVPEFQGRAAASQDSSADMLQDATQAMLGDPALGYLARYGTPVSRRLLPVGGITMWTVISKSGKTVQLYTSADGKALFSGVVWNLETGRNISDSLLTTPGSDGNQAAGLPQVVATGLPKSNLVTGLGSLPSAFDGKPPAEMPEAIKLVDGLAGFKEGKGGPADTLYVIIDPRCQYCRRAYLNLRDYAKAGVTIKWIPTTALGHPEQGVPLATTILRASSPDAVARVLGGHEQISTLPTDSDIKQLDNNLDFMFEAFKQNNEPNPGVPVAFFIDRRTGKARMMLGLSEQAVIEDILGKPKK